MTWETLRPLRATRGFEGIYVHGDGVITLGVEAFEALGQPRRVRLMLNREQYLLGIRSAAADDPEGYGLHAPDEGMSRTSVNAIRAFRRLRVSPRVAEGEHRPKMREGLLVIDFSESRRSAESKAP
jgi:hypothetical protein